MFLEGESESKRAALKVLEVALAQDDLNLLRDLVRFLDLNPATAGTSEVSWEKEGGWGTEESELGEGKGGKGAKSENSDKRKVRMDWKGGGVKSEVQVQASTYLLKGDEEYYLQEVLLSRHARKLLRLRELEAFVIFGEIVNRPLRMWLYREKNRDANVPEEELADLISVIADQFGVNVRIVKLVCLICLTDDVCLPLISNL